MSEKFPTFNSPELAREEAAKMAEKIESGEAKDYNEAEKMAEKEEENQQPLLEKTQEEKLFKKNPKPYGYWVNASLEEIKKEIKSRGLDPINLFPIDRLKKTGHSDLVNNLTRKFGSFSKARKILGGNLFRKPHHYWNNITREELIQEIKSRGLDPENLSSSEILTKNGNGDLLYGLYQIFGDLPNARRSLGGKELRRPDNYWTNIPREELIQEIKSRGLDPANLGSFGYLQEKEPDLVTGLVKKFGSFSEARKALGGKELSKPDGYWENISERELIQEIKSRGLDPMNLSSSEILYEQKHSDLVYGLKKRFGSFLKARNFLTGKELFKPHHYWKNIPQEELVQEIKNRGLDPINLSTIENLRRQGHSDLIIGVTKKFGTFKNARKEIAKMVGVDILSEKEGKDKINKNFDNYIKEVSEGKTVTAQEFKKLIGLFGSSRAFDILYKHHPQFKGVPVDRVKSVLPQYLGNYLLTRPPFSIDDIKDFTDYLSKQTFQEGLFETIKEHALKFYNKERREKESVGELVNSQSVFGKYIQNLKEKTELIKNNNLNQVIKKFEDYYLSLFNDFKKPDKIVEFLKEDRIFPDVNQLINIKEISDNKKMLIADDMGLGKSASVILAKEILSLKRALIITPSNVVEMNTWQDYLSDKISKEGKQIGYFKKGTAPKVLVIKSLDDINDSNLSSCDYIIISQEKLKDNYVNKLKEINYDMLVFDEVHKLKNLKEGERAKRAVELSGKINGSEKYLALLSGTPVPDKIKDLAIILKLLYPEKFTNIKNKELVRQIVTGDIIDLRNLLIPKMQMKELAESIKMPSKRERLIETELSEKGKEIYEMLMEEDELTAIEKIRIFRQFLLNPKIFGISPEIENSKLKNVENFLNQTFKEKNKIVMFVNDYIEGVIRGENSIINELQLSGMNIIIIDGNTPKKERNAKQKEFRESSNKTLLVVSGPTADVGVDFSSGESVVFYNEPWSRYNERQQAGRVYREGVKNDIDVNIFVTKNSIEEGLYRYIRIKEKSVEKLLKGIPITDIEKEHLLKDEKRNDSGLEENSELAKYYFNSWDRMLKIFAHIKEMGEKNFLDFTRKYGKEYAKCYIDFGGRSYQSNTARVIGTVISKLVEENKQSNNDLRILDIASGPEMLKRHILEKHQNKIFSMDINESHFEEPGEGKRLVGSFLNLPVKDKIFDYANLSLAFHYTENKKPYKERIKVLSEMNRVLKVGGRALINFTYSLNLQDEQRFKKIFDNLGFKIIENYSGQVNCGDNYKSRLITLEKINDIKENERINDDSLEGLRLNKTNEILKNQRKIIKEFIIGNKKMTVDFNKEDYELLKKEEEVIKIGENLKRKYGSVKNIPAEEIKRHDFILFPVPKKNRYEYLLFKSLGDKKGNVVIK